MLNYYTLSEAAERTGVCTDHILRMGAEGKLQLFLRPARELHTYWIPGTQHLEERVQRFNEDGSGTTLFRDLCIVRQRTLQEICAGASTTFGWVFWEEACWLRDDPGVRFAYISSSASPGLLWVSAEGIEVLRAMQAPGVDLPFGDHKGPLAEALVRAVAEWPKRWGEKKPQLVKEIVPWIAEMMPEDCRDLRGLSAFSKLVSEMAGGRQINP